MDEPREPDDPKLSTLIWWMIGTALAGFVIWFIYVSSAISAPTGDSSGFDLGLCNGGAASSSSFRTAGVLGAGVWLVSAVAESRLRHRLGSIFFGFVVLYSLGLVALYYVSPRFWGPRQCG